MKGIEKLRIEKPDLAILDVMMDTTHDGFEMSRLMRKDQEFKDISILILTSIDDVTGVNFKTAMSNPDWLPADGYLDKPVESDVLLEEIKLI